MKKLLLLLLVIVFQTLRLSAQFKIVLPAYQEGKFESDTIITHPFNILSSSGKGEIFFSNISPNFISGMHFYFYVDSLDFGSAPSPSSYIDSAGIKIPMRERVKYLLPVKLESMADKMRFHVILEGVPTKAGESYLCELGIGVVLSNDYIRAITPGTQQQCFVDMLKEVNTIERYKSTLCLYPNPVTDNLVINGISNSNMVSSYAIFDQLGKEVQTGAILHDNHQISVGKLSPGIYTLQIDSQRIKFVKE